MSNYRWLAKLYALCEALVFGQALQRCRTAFINTLPDNVLSIGEGDGRFSQALLRKNPQTSLSIIEPDDAMRAEVQKRTPQARWVTDWNNLKEVDAIVMNFIFDCFTEEEAQAMVEKIADFLPAHGLLIVGDFFPEETEPSWKRSLARILVHVMYCFFHTITGLAVTRLPPTRQLLEKAGWRCLQENTQWSGFIRAQRWQKKEADLGNPKIGFKK